MKKMNKGKVMKNQPFRIIAVTGVFMGLLVSGMSSAHHSQDLAVEARDADDAIKTMSTNIESDQAFPAGKESVSAEAICKCNGDSVCGGGKIHKKTFKTRGDCKNAQKEAQRICNHDLADKCKREVEKDGKKYQCRYKHVDVKCPSF